MSLRTFLLHDGRRFLPAVLAIAFTGLLLVVQTGLVLGIFGSAALPITHSSADLWVASPGTPSVNLGRPINDDLEMALRLHPEVIAVEPLRWVDSDWTLPQRNRTMAISVTGIRPARDSLLFDQLLSPQQREALMQPMAVIVDRSSLQELGTQPGETAWIGDRAVHVIAAVRGLRALGGINVISSLDTAHMLSNPPPPGRQYTYLVARLRQPAHSAAVAASLRQLPGFGAYDIWTADEFAWRSQLFWLLDTGAGIAVLFMAGIVLLVGTVTTSQALTGLVTGSAREYATLHALGVGRRSLRHIVLRQCAWIAGLGLLLAALLSTLLLTLARQQDVPVAMTLPAAAACAALILLLALASGLAAMRGLLRADTSLLLR